MSQLGLRYYSSGLGRWTRQDPIGERGGRSLFAFLANSPLKHVDLLGKEAVVAHGDEDAPSEQPDHQGVVTVPMTFSVVCRRPEPGKGFMGGARWTTFALATGGSGAVQKVPCEGGQLVVGMFPSLGMPPNVPWPANYDPSIPTFLSGSGVPISGNGGCPQANATGKTSIELFGKYTKEEKFGTIFFPDAFSKYTYGNAKFDIEMSVKRYDDPMVTKPKLFRKWETMYRTCGDCVHTFEANRCGTIEVKAGNAAGHELWMKYEITPFRR